MAPNNSLSQPQNRPYPPRHSSFEHRFNHGQSDRLEHARPQEDDSEEQRVVPHFSHGVVASHFLAQPQNVAAGETWIDFLSNPAVPDHQPHVQSSSSRHHLPNRPLPRTDSSSSRSSDRKRRLTSAESPGRRRSSIRPHPDNMGSSVSNPVVVSSSPAAMRAQTIAGPPSVQPPRPTRRDSDLVLPLWQPDTDVSNCPVCGRNFTFLYRKHHCRKCGRVVCASCSPHRITIPRQFIVHPPNDPSLNIIDLTGDDDNTMSPFGPFRNPALGGGEEVRVCNPCVPDPNYSPPLQFSNAPPRYFPQQPNITRPAIPLSSASLPREHVYMPTGHDASRNTVQGQAPRFQPSGDNRRISYHGSTVSGERWLPPLPVAGQTSNTTRGQSASRLTFQQSGQLPFHTVAGSQSIANMFPRPLSTQPTPTIPTQPPRRPRRQIAEEDECPICGDELPSKGPDGDEAPREQHIEECLALHSASPAPIPLTQQTSASLPNQRTRGMSNAADASGPGPSNANRLSHAARGMFPFVATEKDCVDVEGNEEECIICFEEYEAGDKLARLVCWCRFHEKCIREWWDMKGRGACPTHQLHE